MEYIKAASEHVEQIFALVQKTITTVYPNYYPAAVVDFFCRLHSKERIKSDIESGNVDALFLDDKLIGTGSREGNHITRVYVDPECQGQGCGSRIMQHLEDEIAQKYNVVRLDASLPASRLYEKRGYQTVKHEKYEMADGAVLIYEIMEKNLKK